MASEFTTLVNFQCTNGNFTNQFQVSSSYNQTAQGANSGILTVLTGGSVLPVGSVTSNGFLTLRNLDVTNALQLQTTTGTGGAYTVFGRLNAGEWAVLRVDPTATLKATALAGSPNLAFCLYQN